MLVTQSSMSVQQMEPPHGRQECFLASVLVPRASSTRDIVALETAMQGLAQDDRHPVALELAATATSRGFLLRATSDMALSHLCGQIQARYPQAIIQPVAIGQDPLTQREDEAVSVVELCAGAAAYLPLRAFREREWQQEGADPLLGILGVFNHLPPQMRIVTQLALLPASPTWSSPYLRKAVEHPLEQEHLRARSVLSGRQASGPSTFQLLGLGVLVALLLVWWRFQKQINGHIPSWVVQAALSLLHGKAPQLSQGQASLLVVSGIVAFVALFFLAFVFMQIRRRLGGTSIYDRRLVEEKTARPAYRVRLRHNLLAVASTGKGKSTLFQHLAQTLCVARAGMDEADRPGLAFIEPHGDVVHALCGLLPPRERDSVVLVDLADGEYPVGINPLDMVGRDRDKAVDTLITLSEHLWTASYGSRTENVLEYALKTLADANEWLIASDPYQGPDRQYTLLDVVALLRLPSFRHAVLEQVRDGMLLDWWQHYYEPMDAHQQREITSSVITKLSKFASSRVARRILGQSRSTLDLREVVRQGKLLLVSTASGVVGSDLSELIGIVLLGLFEAALAEQASVPFEQRRRYLVLIDEFQVYRNANYQGMLAELRKYGGSFALATQSLAYLDRLDRTLRATVLANIDHLFAFHMAGEDARLLHELDGILEDDITSLDDFQCYVKLSLGGHRLPVFSLALDAPPPPDEQLAQFVRLRSRGRDARPSGVADDLILQSQARQRGATATKPRALSRNKADEPPRVAGHVKEEVESTRRHKKRGSGSQEKQEAQAAPVQVHLMYREEGEDVPDRDEVEEGGAPNAGNHS